jgi:hypothetical protein
VAGRDVKEGREDGPEPCDRRGEAQRGARPLTEGRPTKGRGLAPRRAFPVGYLPTRPERSGFGLGGWAFPSAICGLPSRRVLVMAS